MSCRFTKSNLPAAFDRGAARCCKKVFSNRLEQASRKRQPQMRRIRASTYARRGRLRSGANRVVPAKGGRVESIRARRRVFASAKSWPRPRLPAGSQSSRSGVDPAPGWPLYPAPSALCSNSLDSQEWSSSNSSSRPVSSTPSQSAHSCSTETSERQAILREQRTTASVARMHRSRNDAKCREAPADQQDRPAPVQISSSVPCRCPPT